MDTDTVVYRYSLQLYPVMWAYDIFFWYTCNMWYLRRVRSGRFSNPATVAMAQSLHG